MDFVDTMRQLFGYNPATGELLQGGRLPGPGVAPPATTAPEPVTGAPLSPEAADGGAATPQGRVLARLGDTRRILTPSQEQPAFGSSLAGTLGAGAEAVKPGMDKTAAFFAGLGGGMKHVETKAEAARKAQIDAQKASIDLYKAMFDMDGKTADRDRQARVDAQNATRLDRQDAETKRWHDIQAPYYKDGGSRAAREMTPKDTALTEKYVQERSGYDPADENWKYLSKPEQDRRRKLFGRIYRNTFGREPIDFENPDAPTPGTPKATPPTPKTAPTPAPTSVDTEDQDKGAEEGAAAPKPKVAPSKPAPVAPQTAQPQPAPAVAAPAAPEVWRKARNKADGSVWLIGPNGERKPFLESGKAPITVNDLAGD